MLPSLGASFSYDSGAAMKLRLDRVEKPGIHYSGKRWGVGSTPPGVPVSPPKRR